MSFMITVLSRALPLKTHQSVYLLDLDNERSLARDMRMGETRACLRDLYDTRCVGSATCNLVVL